MATPESVLPTTAVPSSALPSPSVAQSVAFQRRISACIAAFGVASSGAAKAADQRYVDDDAPPGGDGRTWQTAYTHIQQALEEARQLQQGFQILVAQGRYYPDPARLDRFRSFELNSGTTLFGGFRGLTGGGEPWDRDVDLFKTYIDGDIGVVGQHEDDSLVLLDLPGWGRSGALGFYLDNAASAAVFADVGCRVELGHLRVTGCRGGAGAVILDTPRSFFIVESTFMFMPTRGLWIKSGGSWEGWVGHCRFEGLRAPSNSALAPMGGAIRSTNNGRLRVHASEFVNNEASWHGGAIAADGFEAWVSQCLFERNTAGEDGGAVWVDGPRITLSACTFDFNRAMGAGGAAFVRGSELVTVMDCALTRNTAGGDGGALRVEADRELRVERCVAEDNFAGGDGGALGLDAGWMTMSACALDLNRAIGTGGGAFLRAPHGAWVFDNVLTRNAAGGDAGAMLIESGASVLMERARLDQNTAGDDVGALRIQADDGVFVRSLWASGNEASGHAGAMEIVAERMLLSGVTLDLNTAGGSGGGLLARVAEEVWVYDARLFGNRAGRDGGGLDIEATHETRVARCLASGNRANGDGGAMRLVNPGRVIVNRSLLAGNIAGVGVAETARGGGAFLSSGVTEVVGCTVIGNSLASIQGAGAGVFEAQDTFFLFNCIVKGNAGPSGAGSLAAQVAPMEEAWFTSCILPESGRGQHNMLVDPRLDAAFRLMPDSPAINSGRSYPWYSEDSLWDLDGRPVVARLYDIGCYEYQDLLPECNRADFGGHAIRGLAGYAIPDQRIGSEDFFIYLNLYAAQDVAADLSKAGSVPGGPGWGVPDFWISPDDFVYFMSEYAAGC